MISGHSECASVKQSLMMTQPSAWWISGRYWAQEKIWVWLTKESGIIRLQPALQQHCFQPSLDRINLINMERETTHSKEKDLDPKNKNWKTDKKSGEDAIQRTFFVCWDKKRFRPYTEAIVFSWLNTDSSYIPVPAPTLPSDWDTRGHSMASLRLWETKTIKEF